MNLVSRANKYIEENAIGQLDAIENELKSELNALCVGGEDNNG